SRLTIRRTRSVNSSRKEPRPRTRGRAYASATCPACGFLRTEEKHTMNRRKFLAGSLAAAAASGFRFRSRGLELGGEASAQGTLEPYPVVVIMLKGGLDQGMHLVATPNGTTIGSQQTVNRMSGDSGIKVAPRSGIRYFTGSVAAPGKADFEPHLPDVALLR